MPEVCTCGCHQVTWDEFYVHVVACCDKTNVTLPWQDSSGSGWLEQAQEGSEPLQAGGNTKRVEAPRQPLPDDPHDPTTCVGPIWCAVCLAEKAAKATARRSAARRGARTRRA